MPQKPESTKIGIITLFASSSTLICCALPALFVSIGAGATLASMVNMFPQLIIISEYKIYITIGAVIILLIAGVLIKKSELLPCPVDPELRDICLKTRKRSKTMYYVSVIIFVSASFFTYLLPIYL
ncbi:MAG: hypothetical protein CMD43_01390 [Gammaproteobacteria bacterium]|nr:hypothetical protein [Gammaproteobacteria bacterium]|tara:strand:- start:230 stop:607 length:378 start_codon:yes stop_codon:yes gene_type:complete